MSPPSDILQTRAVSRFTCIGDRCSDTCCKGWSMQLDEAMFARYQKEAPELLNAVEPSQEAPWIMKKDKATGVCVKLENGLCGIHKTYGDTFLGDACYFYPRVTRSLGNETLMTATLSCPEIARLALLADDANVMETRRVDRLPHGLKNYLPPDMTAEQALAIHRAFLDAAGDKANSAEYNFLHIASASRSMERIDKKSWPQATPFYLKNAGISLPAAEKNDADPFNLLHALSGLIVASQKPMSDRLKQTVAEMEQGLEVKLNWQQVQIETGEGSLAAYQAAQQLWKKKAHGIFAPLLRRWLMMQLSVALYPFSGFGTTLPERITILGVRLATVKLALMCSYARQKEKLPEEDVIRIVQSISRFLDHLGDPAFSLKIYSETGWTKEARMRGLVEI